MGAGPFVAISGPLLAVGLEARQKGCGEGRERMTAVVCCCVLVLVFNRFLEHLAPDTIGTPLVFEFWCSMNS